MSARAAALPSPSVVSACSAREIRSTTPRRPSNTRLVASRRRHLSLHTSGIPFHYKYNRSRGTGTGTGTGGGAGYRDRSGTGTGTGTGGGARDRGYPYGRTRNPGTETEPPQVRSSSWSPGCDVTDCTGVRSRGRALSYPSGPCARLCPCPALTIICANCAAVVNSSSARHAHICLVAHVSFSPLPPPRAQLTRPCRRHARPR